MYTIDKFAFSSVQPDYNIECLFDSVGTVCISTNLNLNITYLQGKELIIIYISCIQCKFNLDHQGLVAQRNCLLSFIDQGLNHPSSIVVTYWILVFWKKKKKNKQTNKPTNLGHLTITKGKEVVLLFASRGKKMLRTIH